MLRKSSVAGAQASVQSDTGRTIIAASGQARQAAIPDRATLILLIEPQAMSVEEASKRLVAVEKAVLDTLRRFGLPANAIQSFSSGVAPYRNNMNQSMNGPSFAGRSMIRVELTRLDQLPAITSAALSKGASFVNSPSYSYRRRGLGATRSATASVSNRTARAGSVGPSCWRPSRQDARPVFHIRTELHK